MYRYIKCDGWEGYDPGSFFTRDDINEFAEEVADRLRDHFNSSGIQFSEVWMIGDGRTLEVTIYDKTSGEEYVSQHKIDMRRIYSPRDLIRNYTDMFVNDFIDQMETEYD